MTSHKELAAEMPMLEKLPPAERIKLAKKRRQQQLKRWTQFEKSLRKERKRRSTIAKYDKHGMMIESKKKSVRFEDARVLQDAVVRNDVKEVQRLVTKSHINVNAAKDDGITPLHQCCIEGFDEMCKVLIELGADVNCRDTELWTPLHAAAACGHLECVKKLTAAGANLLAVNSDLNMPYDICEHADTYDYLENQMSDRGITQTDIEQMRSGVEQRMLHDMQALVEKGGDVNQYRDKFGATALHIAVANGFAQVAEYLLRHGAATTLTDDDGWLPVHAAAYWGQETMLQLLVLNGASLDVLTKRQQSVVDLCQDDNFREAIVRLRDDVKARRIERIRTSVRQSIQAGSLSSHVGVQRNASVKRMSVRDKLHTTKREIAEEGCLLKVNSPLGSLDEDKPAAADATVPQASASVVQDPTADEVQMERMAQLAKHIHEKSRRTSLPSCPEEKEEGDALGTVPVAAAAAPPAGPKASIPFNVSPLSGAAAAPLSSEEVIRTTKATFRVKTPRLPTHSVSAAVPTAAAPAAAAPPAVVPPVAAPPAAAPQAAAPPAAALPAPAPPPNAPPAAASASAPPAAASASAPPPAAASVAAPPGLHSCRLRRATPEHHDQRPARQARHRTAGWLRSARAQPHH